MSKCLKSSVLLVLFLIVSVFAQARDTSANIGFTFQPSANYGTIWGYSIKTRMDVYYYDPYTMRDTDRVEFDSIGGLTANHGAVKVRFPINVPANPPMMIRVTVMATGTLFQPLGKPGNDSINGKYVYLAGISAGNGNTAFFSCMKDTTRPKIALFMSSDTVKPLGVLPTITWTARDTVGVAKKKLYGRIDPDTAWTLLDSIVKDSTMLFPLTKLNLANRTTGMLRVIAEDSVKRDMGIPVGNLDTATLVFYIQPTTNVSNPVVPAAVRGVVQRVGFYDVLGRKLPARPQNFYLKKFNLIIK